MNPLDLTILQRIIPIILSLLIVISTIELIRRRKLREELAILWILASLVLLAFAVYPNLLWIISRWLGMFYLTTMVLAGFAFLSMVMIHMATTLSALSAKNSRVAQRLALLEERLSQLGVGPDAQRAKPSEDA